jgi:hypothetical protein
MSAGFWLSYVALWLLVCTLAVVTLVRRRSRQLELKSGGVGSLLPAARLDRWNGGSVTIPWVGVPQMVLFGRPGCDYCRLALEAVVTLANEELSDVKWLFVYSGTNEQADLITARLTLGAVAFALGGETLRQQLEITTMPFVVAINRAGTIAAREPVRNRRHLESLARSLRPVEGIA